MLEYGFEVILFLTALVCYTGPNNIRASLHMLNEILISLILPVAGAISSNPPVAIGLEPGNVLIIEAHADDIQAKKIEIMAGR